VVKSLSPSECTEVEDDGEEKRNQKVGAKVSR